MILKLKLAFIKTKYFRHTAIAEALIALAAKKRPTLRNGNNQLLNVRQ